MRALARRLVPLLLTPALVLSGLALLSPDNAAGQTALPGDPPARVGRLSHVEGQVSARPPEQADWSAAVLNYPVSTGLSLWTEPGARAEISYGDGALRLDHETAIAVERLDDSALDLRLDQGSVQLSVRQLEPGERVSITTPQGRMEALAPGTYRIDAGTGETPAGVTVLDGKARFADQGRSVEAVGGESVIVKPDGSLGTVAAIRQPFDDWALARETEVKAATVTPRHLPQSMPGREDLERHGNWQETPEYGAVWYPAAVPVGWAPYRYGHWAWVHPWGWTWIDDAPWGFAPFHYGRWAHYHGRWCWVPGRYARARPVYSPALVAFVGGSNFSIAVSIGRAPAIGWVPLGPREVYYPPYRSSVTYVRNVNVVQVNRTVINNINVTNIRRGPPQRDGAAFVNARGATVVPVDAMRRAEPVHRAAPKREFDRADLAGARPTTNLAALQPSRAARAGFETERDAAPRGPDRNADRRDDGPRTRELGAGRPVTSDPDRLPSAPGPRREARAAPEQRGGPDRGGPDRGGPERGEAQRTQPSPAAPTVGRATPRQDGPDRDRGDRQRAAPQLIQPSAGTPSRPPSPREGDTRETRPREAARPSPDRRDTDRGESGRERPQQRLQAMPAPREEPAARSRMPTVHGPGHDQGRMPDRNVTRDDRPLRVAPVARIEPPNVQQRRFEARPADQTRIEQPRVERPRVDSPRMESPRVERPRAEPQRVERRAEPPRPEVQSAAPQRSEPPQRAERREQSRRSCSPGADCSR